MPVAVRGTGRFDPSRREYAIEAVADRAFRRAPYMAVWLKSLSRVGSSAASEDTLNGVTSSIEF